MYRTVLVGSTVVGCFHTLTGAIKCVAQIAPGCRARIKKGYHPRRVVAQKRNNIEARQRVNQIGDYQKVVYLRPGEFKL